MNFYDKLKLVKRLKQRKKIEWLKLDNASKVFPALANYKDTKVFRLACELYEAVDPEILQQALDTVIKTYPLYQSVLRRGIFWYYLESSDIKPEIEIESTVVCAPLYFKDKKTLLFRVSYYNNRINLEVFHALSDGVGALKFMGDLVYHYINFKHDEITLNKAPKLYHSGSLSQQMDDSFGRYYSGGDAIKALIEKLKTKRQARAYQIKGSTLDDNRTVIIEGSMSARAVLDEAHAHNATLTVFIASLFIYSIYKDMHVNSRKQRIVLQIPVNLRQFYESETMRNFFGSMGVAYYFTENGSSLDDIVPCVRESFHEELKEENLGKQLNGFMSLERSLLLRIFPLPLKDMILRTADRIVDRRVTALVSNIGRIAIPEELSAYIRQFSVANSAKRPQIILCSFGDRLAVSFSSPFREMEIQRIFFEYLSKKGISIEISSNR